jgi:hypothetical protein
MTELISKEVQIKYDGDMKNLDGRYVVLKIGDGLMQVKEHNSGRVLWLSIARIIMIFE